MEIGIVTVLYFFAEKSGRFLKSFYDFWSILFLNIMNRGLVWLARRNGNIVSALFEFFMNKL